MTDEVEVATPARPRWWSRAVIGGVLVVVLVIVLVNTRGSDRTARQQIAPAATEASPDTNAPETSAAQPDTTVADSVTDVTSIAEAATSTSQAATSSTSTKKATHSSVPASTSSDMDCAAILAAGRPKVPNLVGLTTQQAYRAHIPIYNWGICTHGAVYIVPYTMAGGGPPTVCTTDPSVAGLVASQSVPPGSDYLVPPQYTSITIYINVFCPAPPVDTTPVATTPPPPPPAT